MRKRTLRLIGSLSVGVALLACGRGQHKGETNTMQEEENIVPEYTVMDLPLADSGKFSKDTDGYIVLFDGHSLEGWRGYGRREVPSRWTLDNGTLKFNGTKDGQKDKNGGDLIFAQKFRNFELVLDWKVAEGSNSGIFYLAQEIEGQPIYISAPEYQILDNENHPDAQKGVDGNRKSASLYDMIPAKPQNAKPAGEWNQAKIKVDNGTVTHYQNGEQVVQYTIGTPEWTALLRNSKFSQEKWPLAFELLNKVGQPGFIGLQDHRDDVWYRNIRLKILH